MPGRFRPYGNPPPLRSRTALGSARHGHPPGSRGRWVSGRHVFLPTTLINRARRRRLQARAKSSVAEERARDGDTVRHLFPRELSDALGSATEGRGELMSLIALEPAEAGETAP